jgi:hypothetical protein
MVSMPDFWARSGFVLTDRDAAGKLVVTDSLLRAWWCRPEVSPVPESCDRERALHAALLDEPRRLVSATELEALEDPDARESYGVMLAFRERLLASPTLEAAYLDIFRGGNVAVPAVFIDQLAHMIVHNVLSDTDDPLELRAAELFFRSQKVSLQEGAIMLADADTVNLHASGGSYGDLGRLLVESNIKPRSIDLDVIDRDNAETYWTRDEAYDTVISFNDRRAALPAFCRVMEKWVRHFFDVEVAIKPLRKIENQSWAWHIGLDAEATAILNDLYMGAEVDAERNRRILSLFQLDIPDASVVRPDVAGRPVWMACAMNAGEMVRIKPQNLLLNLPLASIS